MFYHKKGFPEEDDLVICKVTKVYPNSVFCDLMFYKLQGMIKISEVSPGRIRNIRNYVKEGKVIVCKVLHIDKERKHIHLSLRRVNEMQKKIKLNEMKQEQKAESIIKFVSEKNKKDTKIIYEKVSKNVFKAYPNLFDCFRDVSKGETTLEKLGVEKDLAKQIEEIVKERIKPPKVFIKGMINLKSYSENGVEDVKKILSEIEKLAENIVLSYKAGGQYLFETSAEDYKKAEKDVAKLEEYVENKKSDKDIEISFEREKKK